MKTKCPVCGNPEAEECAEEVDIGVGMQRHVWGFECPTCGQIPVHWCCGGVNTHPAWCNYAPGN
jgi:hypothetical protein